MILEQIKDLISQQLSIDTRKITLESDLKDDLGIDSIDAVGLVIKIEEFYKINISDETLQQFKIVKDIIDYIEKNTEAKNK